MDSVNTAALHAVQTTFDDWAKQGRGERMESGHWPTASQILERLNLKPGQHFLDIGCGIGYTVEWAARHVSPNGKAVGVDLSPEMIARAKSRVQANHTDFQVADASSLPFKDQTFDAIVNIESLYYYGDMPAALSDIYRVLKPGGWFAAMVDFYAENPYCHPWPELVGLPMTLLSETDYSILFLKAGFEAIRTERLYNPDPVDAGHFTPGWGYDTVSDVEDFRQRVGSLAIWGQRPDES